MRALTSEEIEQATDPEARNNYAQSPTGLQLTNVTRSVGVGALRVYTDRASYQLVCARLGVDPKPTD